MLTQHQSPDTPALPTVLLRHDEPGEARAPHYDWMLADPTLLHISGHTPPSPDDRWLWTARVALPSSRWRESAWFEIEPIAHHRWQFLTFEGAISANRGVVQRVDEGRFTVLHWEACRIEVRLDFRAVQGTLRIAPLARLSPVTPVKWRATWA